MRGDATVEVEKLGQPIALVPSSGGDGDEFIGSGNDSADGNGDDVDK